MLSARLCAAARSSSFISLRRAASRRSNLPRSRLRTLDRLVLLLSTSCPSMYTTPLTPEAGISCAALRTAVDCTGCDTGMREVCAQRRRSACTARGGKAPGRRARGGGSQTAAAATWPHLARPVGSFYEHVCVDQLCLWAQQLLQLRVQLRPRNTRTGILGSESGGHVASLEGFNRCTGHDGRPAGMPEAQRGGCNNDAEDHVHESRVVPPRFDWAHHQRFDQNDAWPAPSPRPSCSAARRAVRCLTARGGSRGESRLPDRCARPCRSNPRLAQAPRSARAHRRAGRRAVPRAPRHDAAHAHDENACATFGL